MRAVKTAKATAGRGARGSPERHQPSDLPSTTKQPPKVPPVWEMGPLHWTAYIHKIDLLFSNPQPPVPTMLLRSHTKIPETKGETSSMAKVICKLKLCTRRQKLPGKPYYTIHIRAWVNNQKLGNVTGNKRVKEKALIPSLIDACISMALISVASTLIRHLVSNDQET